MKRPNKKIMLILSIFLVFLVMGAASAADDSVSEGNETLAVEDTTVSEDIVSEDTNDENSEVLSDGNSETGTLTDLKNEIYSGGYGDIVVLNKDYKYNNDSDFDLIDGINVRGYLTIDGQNHTIDGNGMSKIFTVLGDEVILKNIKFTNANKSAVSFDTDVHDCSVVNCIFTNNHGNNGGAIYTGGRSFNLISCIFINNTADNRAGAVFCAQNTEYIKECIFINNSAQYGGAVTLAWITCGVENSVFRDNKASLGGGAIEATTPIGIINKCNFTNNFAGFDGGAISNHALQNSAIPSLANLKVSNCIFDSNKGSDIHNVKDNGGNTYLNSQDNDVHYFDNIADGDVSFGENIVYL